MADCIDLNAPVIARVESLVHAPINTVWALHCDVNAWPKWQKDITQAELHAAFEEGISFAWRTSGLDETIISKVQCVIPRKKTLWSGP